MSEKRKRGQNFTAEEKDKLVKIIASYKDIILNKKTDGTTNEAKLKAWVDVTNTFNSCATIYRTKDSLMKVWDKLKTESKLYCKSSKTNISGTGGGPSEVKVDPILEQVCSLLGRACTGIIGVHDCDAEEFQINNLTQLGTNSEQNIMLNIESDENVNVITEFEVDFAAVPTATPSDCNTINMEENHTKVDSLQEKINICKTPLWSRRRPQLPHTNERTELMSSLCSSYTNVNKKKEHIEEIKKQLLQDELDFKRKLYDLQLQAATKELEIKTEILNQIKGGAINLQNLFGVPRKE